MIIARHIIESKPGSNRFKLVVSPPGDGEGKPHGHETRDKIIFLICMYIFIALFVWTYSIQSAHAQEITETDLVTQTETGDFTDTDSGTTEESSGSKFDSRDRLIATLLGEPMDGEEEDPISEEDIPEGDNNETDPGEDTTVAENETEPANDIPGETETGDSTELETAQLDETQVTAFVESLSDEQVFAMNRSLNNAVNSGLEIEYDMELLQKIVDEDYNKQQINSLTQALEQEARFLSKYEETGDEKFLFKAERQKEKFLAKTDWFGGMKDVMKGDVSKEAAREARQAAKNSAKDAAKSAVKDAAKSAARDAAKLAAKDAAKGAAKSAAKLAAKDAAKVAIKDAIKVAKNEIQKEYKKAGKQGKGK